MKTNSLWTVLLTMLLLPTACGKTAQEPVDLSKSYLAGMDTIRQQLGDVPMMEEENDPDVLEIMYPGLRDIDHKQLVVWVSPIAQMPAEVAMVEVTSANDAQAAADIFKDRIAFKAEDAFYPDAVAQWKNAAQVSVSGNYVVLAVMPRGVALPNEFLAKF